jgi:hypothetical protein
MAVKYYKLISARIQLQGKYNSTKQQIDYHDIITLKKIALQLQKWHSLEKICFNRIKKHFYATSNQA